MRIIISRKGFDSGSGGVPSPVLPDSSLLSLPIPGGSQHTHNDLQGPGGLVLAAEGQEFVMDVGNRAEAMKWITDVASIGASHETRPKSTKRGARA